MTELKRRLISRIRNLGPLTVADFMAETMAQRPDSYYRSGNPLGAAGDFITAPEISQMFGELIGAWLADRWQALGQPSRVMLVELGPGRGTLMADALRATQNVKGFHPAIDLHLVEINETLRQMQANAIAAISPGIAPHWHESFGALADSDTPMLLIANEFFDALPIRQLQRSEHYWRERCIAIDEGSENLRFKLTPGASPLAILLPVEAPEPKPGDIAEVSPPSLSLMQAIAERIAHNRGAALIVDYARQSPYGATLQAVAQHRMVDPLAQPGAADLSALVDFASLRRVALQAKASVYGPVGQGAFLTALGIGLRAQALKAHADESRRIAIDAAQARLIGPGQMGNLFQVLAVTDKQQSIPAGFAL